MSFVQILGLVAAAMCLLAYLLRPGRVFDWCNAVLWPVVAVASFQAGAWGPLLLNLGFGLAGVWHLIRARRLTYPTPEMHLYPTPEQQGIIVRALQEAGGPLMYQDTPLGANVPLSLLLRQDR